MLKLTIGQDLSCYATIDIPEDTPLTREALGEIVHHIVEEAEWQGILPPNMHHSSSAVVFCLGA